MDFAILMTQKAKNTSLKPSLMVSVMYFTNGQMNRRKTTTFIKSTKQYSKPLEKRCARKTAYALAAALGATQRNPYITIVRNRVLSMNHKRSIFFAGLICFSAMVFADPRSEAIEGFRKEIQSCKTSSDQVITFDLVAVSGKPASEPASPEELVRVKDLLEKSKLPYDPINHRATYEFTLALVRAKNMAVFKVTGTSNASDLSAVRDCLGQMASSGGLEFRFE
jgi:hypothetical protein